jgi:flagellar P-ring protein precursor FlgI
MKPILALLAFLAASGNIAGATRLKELVTVEGVRDNQLMGYGLVVGLAGTGDRVQTVFSAQSLTNLLERMGLTVSPSAIQVKNTAAVMITATLPPFSQSGSRIDVTVAAMGDSPSLQGGVLLMTGLRGPDGQIYAVAQGPLVLGGFLAGGGANAKVVNHPTVGRIPNGAIIERGAPSVNLGTTIHLQLRRGDFTTAARVVEAINGRFGEVARAENSGLITVSSPARFEKNSTGFLSELEGLSVETDADSRIVVNERTGTIVMGKDVKIAPVAIMQGNLTIEVRTTLNVTQTGARGAGTATVTPETDVSVKQEPARQVLLRDGATVEDLVRALSAIGSSPRDIIAILQSLKQAGALDAELIAI